MVLENWLNCIIAMLLDHNKNIIIFFCFEDFNKGMNISGVLTFCSVLFSILQNRHFLFKHNCFRIFSRYAATLLCF